uniref:Galectin n=2 Tax=Monopterus albus TaxID=43700 RepID=A0A3Q3IM89_MONAL
MTVKNMSFKVGQTMTIVGVPNRDAASFSVNIAPDEQEVALHFNPRFGAHGDNNTVVCNSYERGRWGQEQRVGRFPFHRGEECKIIIGFTSTEFLVTLADDSQIHFPNRLGLKKYSVITFKGDVRIRSFKIK